MKNRPGKCTTSFYLKLFYTFSFLNGCYSNPSLFVGEEIFFVTELVTEVYLNRVSDSSFSLSKILCSWRQIIPKRYLSAKYESLCFIETEFRDLTLIGNNRTSILILIIFSASPFVPLEQILPGEFNIWSLLKIWDEAYYVQWLAGAWILVLFYSFVIFRLLNRSRHNSYTLSAQLTRVGNSWLCQNKFDLPPIHQVIGSTCCYSQQRVIAAFV